MDSRKRGSWPWRDLARHGHPTWTSFPLWSDPWGWGRAWLLITCRLTGHQHHHPCHTCRPSVPVTKPCLLSFLPLATSPREVRRTGVLLPGWQVQRDEDKGARVGTRAHILGAVSSEDDQTGGSVNPVFLAGRPGAPAGPWEVWALGSQEKWVSRWHRSEPPRASRSSEVVSAAGESTHSPPAAAGPESSAGGKDTLTSQGRHPEQPLCTRTCVHVLWG